MMQSNGSDGRYLPPPTAGMDYAAMEAVHHHPGHHPGLVDPHLHYGLAPPHPHHPHQGLHGLGQPGIPPPIAPPPLTGGAGVKRNADSAGLEMMGGSDSDEDSMIDVKPAIGADARGRGSSSKNSGGDSVATSKKTRGRVKIKMEFIDNKLRRYTTFSKRKTGIMKKAYELSTLTGTQVMLLVASETGHVYTFATRKLQPMITSEAGKTLIQTCLNSPDPPNSGGSASTSTADQRMSATGYEETELTYNVPEDITAAEQQQKESEDEDEIAATAGVVDSDDEDDEDEEDMPAGVQASNFRQKVMAKNNENDQEERGEADEEDEEDEEEEVENPKVGDEQPIPLVVKKSTRTKPPKKKTSRMVPKSVTFANPPTMQLDPSSRASFASSLAAGASTAATSIQAVTRHEASAAAAVVVVTTCSDVTRPPSQQTDADPLSTTTAVAHLSPAVAPVPAAASFRMQFPQQQPQGVVILSGGGTGVMQASSPVGAPSRRISVPIQSLIHPQSVQSTGGQPSAAAAGPPLAVIRPPPITQQLHAAQLVNQLGSIGHFVRPDGTLVRIQPSLPANHIGTAAAPVTLMVASPVPPIAAAAVQPGGSQTITPTAPKTESL